METERDARLMQELQYLMREYVEHQGRAVGSLAGVEGSGQWGKGAGRSSSGGGRSVAVEEGDGQASDLEGRGGWEEEWGDEDEDGDLLNLVREKGRAGGRGFRETKKE